MEGKELAGIDGLKFILAGNATFTLRSSRTGDRRTYKIQASEDKGDGKPTVWFVRTLTGPDNTADYAYIGMISNDLHFRTTKASRMGADSIPVKAFSWTLDKLTTIGTAPGVEVWHVGRCGRCGRELTVPESIACGFGPECAGKL